jgi:hypothetical protein
LVPTQEVAAVVCSVRLMSLPALTVVVAGVREIVGPAEVAAPPVPQAASTAPADRTSTARSTCTKLRLIPQRVMSYPRFFFWVGHLEKDSRLRLRRRLKDVIRP